MKQLDFLFKPLYYLFWAPFKGTNEYNKYALPSQCCERSAFYFYVKLEDAMAPDAFLKNSHFRSFFVFGAIGK
jgi:hypothetical protein